MEKKLCYYLMPTGSNPMHSLSYGIVNNTTEKVLSLYGYHHSVSVYRRHGITLHYMNTVSNNKFSLLFGTVNNMATKHHLYRHSQLSALPVYGEHGLTHYHVHTKLNTMFYLYVFYSTLNDMIEN